MSEAAAREGSVRLGLPGTGGRQLAEGVVLVALTILILWLRRPDQFSHPYIWGEEGWFLKHYAEGGAWRVLVVDVNGFPQLISKLLALAAFKTAIFAAPQLGVALATAFTCMVILCLRFAPTHLPARFACALMPLVIPSGPECFAVMLYAFWWAGLPVHVTGGKASPLGDFLWRIPFRGADCRALIAQSLIR